MELGRVIAHNTKEKFMTERRFFNANQLKFIALFTMLLDHLYATVFPGHVWMTFIGRIAFPLFAFELVQGYMHTHDLHRYAKRIALLAVLSEIPFNMVAGGSFLFLWHQNVAWTLLAGLAICYCADHLAGESVKSKKLLYLLGLIVALLLPGLLMTDYGTNGIFFILLFWLTRKGGPVCYVVQAIAMFLLSQFLFGGRTLPIGSFELQTQCFDLLALPLIWLYNGKHGSRNKVLQYAAYAFYPVHLLILGIIFMVQMAGMPA